MQVYQIIVITAILLFASADAMQALGKLLAKAKASKLSPEKLSNDGEPEGQELENMLAEELADIEPQAEQEVAPAQPKKKGIGALFSKAKQAVAKKSPFQPRDRTLSALVHFMAVFPHYKDRIAQVISFADTMRSFTGKDGTKPSIRCPETDYAALRVLAIAMATTKANFVVQAEHLWADLGLVKSEKARAKAYWKYLTLVALKEEPASEWRKKPLQDLMRPVAKHIMKTGYQHWFLVPITKAGILPRLGSGKLPWKVEPRSADDMLNGVIAMMAYNGQFRTHTSDESIAHAWKACDSLKNKLFASAVKSLLNKKQIDIQTLELVAGVGPFRDEIARELMTLFAANLKEVMKKGEAAVSVPVPAAQQVVYVTAAPSVAALPQRQVMHKNQ